MRLTGLIKDLTIAAASLVLLLLVPSLVESSALRDFIIYVIAYGLLAMSLNLLVGYSGLVSFGHAAYFASGAYIFGLMMQSGAVSIPVAFVVAVGGTALLALLIGAVCVRLKEIYFAFLTLAFQMLLHSLILTWVSVTGGDQGLTGGIPRPPFLGIDLSDRDSFYAVACVLFVVSLLVLRQVVQSPFGYTLRMIRDNAGRAEYLAVDVVRTKLAAFVLAASIASVGGVVMALFVSGAYPEFAFWTTSGEAIFMIMLGGTQSFLGPLVGTVVFQALNHIVTIYTEYHGLVLGSIILLFVLGLRRGLLDFLLERWPQRRLRPGRRLPAARAAPVEPAEKETLA